MYKGWSPAELRETLLPPAELKRAQIALEALIAIGGHPYIVGGAVRDLILERPPKDVDIEVHNVSLEVLEQVLRQGGIVNHTGTFFGVLRLEHSAIDWSIPRRDFAGRKPDVVLSPAMGIDQALSRRDLTINALALDLVTGQLIDPFGGYQDLLDRRARSPDIRFFSEDPLRFYRVMQFIARFDLAPDDELNRVCASMDITAISHERIEAEFDKLFLLSRRPSQGIRWIEKIGRLDQVLPELARTVGILQRNDWHPEGDVFEHSMQAIDAAAEHKYASTCEKLLIVSAALCHDLGKSVSTFIRDGIIRSTGHAATGVPFAQGLMRRITSHKKRIASVCKLVRYHMEPGVFIKGNASDAAYRRLALRLAPDTNCYLLSLLADADRRGRNVARGKPLPGPSDLAGEFCERADKAGVLYGPEEPVLVGADLLDAIEPGPLLGKALARAYELQINKNITDKKILRKEALAVLKK